MDTSMPYTLSSFCSISMDKAELRSKPLFAIEQLVPRNPNIRTQDPVIRIAHCGRSMLFLSLRPSAEGFTVSYPNRAGLRLSIADQRPCKGKVHLTGRCSTIEIL